MKLKQIIGCAFIFYFTSCFGQNDIVYEDNNNIRWIAVNVDTTNQFLVQKDNLDSTNNLIELIELAAIQEKNVFFLEMQELENKFKLYPHILNLQNKDSLYNLLSTLNLSHNSTYHSENSFLIVLSNKHILKNQLNEDFVFRCGEGLECSAATPSTFYQIPSKNLTKIYIREELVFNPKENKTEYIPVGISFYPIYGNQSNYQIWIDLKKLKQEFSLLENPWYNYFMQKKYKGFQFMQKY